MTDIRALVEMEIEQARASIAALRDHTRMLGQMDFRERDEHVMRLHRALDKLSDALRAAGGPEPGPGAWQPSCPSCGATLHKVRRSSGSMLNEDQFDAVRAGDWYCDRCPSNGRGNTAYRYFWNRELPAPPADATEV